VKFGILDLVLLSDFNLGSTCQIWGHAVAYWLRHYATSRKVTGSIPDEVIRFFSIDLILPAALGPEVYSASNSNEYQESCPCA
jgi:hypothetical protein